MIDYHEVVNNVRVDQIEVTPGGGKFSASIQFKSSLFHKSIPVPKYIPSKAKTIKQTKLAQKKLVKKITDISLSRRFKVLSH